MILINVKRVNETATNHITLKSCINRVWHTRELNEIEFTVEESPANISYKIRASKKFCAGCVQTKLDRNR